MQYLSLLVEMAHTGGTMACAGTSGAATIAKLGAECHTLFPTSPSKVAVCERIANSSVELIEFIEKEVGARPSPACPNVPPSSTPPFGIHSIGFAVVGSGVTMGELAESIRMLTLRRAVWVERPESLLSRDAADPR